MDMRDNEGNDNEVLHMSGHEGNDNEVLHIPQSSSITGTSP